MARFRLLKNSFLGGQISRDAMGRTDLPQYAHACELLQNMIPLLSGGTYRRPGTVYMDYVPANHASAVSPVDNQLYAQSSPPRLFPFIVSNSLAYALMIGTSRWSNTQAVGVNPAGQSGGAYLRYYRASGNANTLASRSISFGAVDLPYRCKVKNLPADASEQVYTRQGGPGAGIVAGDAGDTLQTYDDDIWQVQSCQSNNVMFLTHPDYPPQVIYLNATDDIRTVPYDNSLSGLALAQTRPYINQNSTAATMTVTWAGAITPGVTTGTLTCSTGFFNEAHGPRTSGLPEGASAATDGAIFAIKSSTVATGAGGGIMFVLVRSVTNSTTCTVLFLTAPSSMATGYNTTAWWESAWSNYRGWPGACAVYQQRLCFAATKHQPNALWFTATTAFGVPNPSLATSCKFSPLGDGPSQGVSSGATGILANGRNYTTPEDWVYSPVDDSQGDGQSTGPLGLQPFRISLATTALDAIQYVSPDQQLFVGTATQEWICAPVNGAFDVANSECTIQSHYGSDLVQAIRIGYEMMFVLQNKQEIRAYQYNYFDQSFFGEPVQLFFDEYPKEEEGTSTLTNNYAGRKKIRQMDWDASRSSLWCVDTAGNFFGLTRDRKLSVTAWHTHQLGGYNSAHGVGQNITDNLANSNYYTDSANYLCDGSVVSICSTPNILSGVRDVWMVVKRSYQGGSNTMWSLERMIGANTVRQSAYSVIAPGNAQEPYLIDCAYLLTDNGSPTNYNYTIGSQLSGQSLIGTYYSQAYGIFAIGTQAAVASNGAIALQTALPPDYGDNTQVHTIVVGLGYNSIVQPVRPDPPSPIGTSQSTIKRISKLYARVFKTLMFKAGPPPPTDGTPTIPLELAHFDPAPSGSLAQSPEIFTGDKELFLNNTYTRSGDVYILQDQPLPFTLVSLSLEGVEYEQ